MVCCDHSQGLGLLLPLPLHATLFKAAEFPLLGGLYQFCLYAKLSAPKGRASDKAMNDEIVNQLSETTWRREQFCLRSDE